MSKLYRALGEDVELVNLRAQVEELQSLATRLTVFTAVYEAYWGALPPALDKRLSVYMRSKADKVVIPTAARMVEDVREIVADYKRNEVQQ